MLLSITFQRKQKQILFWYTGSVKLYFITCFKTGYSSKKHDALIDAQMIVAGRA